MKHVCDNCGEIWDTENLEEIRHLWMRVAAGETMPSGECPDCGCLCHPVEDETTPYYAVTGRIVFQDEDSVAVFQTKTQEKAVDYFREYLIDTYPDNPRLEEEDWFIVNHILRSDTKIEV